MHLLMVMGLLVWWAGEGHGVLQALTCPYQVDQSTLPRVWCKQTSAECCRGLMYDYKHPHDGDPPVIHEDMGSFTVSVVSPPNGAGVYWCGVMANSSVLIKLAESYFYDSTYAYIWSIARFVVLPSFLILPSILALNVLVTSRSERKRHHEDSTKVLEEPEAIYINQ
ncbi:uncharacterized protein si:ch211-102c2.4 [Gadus morhua]|uniref:uncharacterized protein si:ch211-102c2.4 n=1 Tax=Gadus morhua TaxID=8049 RepID=UPI0011B49A62|nr:uncharacterized protein LOC115554539 [Gadus morhua]